MNLQTVKLGEIAIQDKVIVSPDSVEALIRPYLGLDQIESQTGKIISYDSTSTEGKSTAFAFNGSHVLYGKLRPYLNKVALPEREGRCSTEIIPLLPNGVDREFLGFLLRREDIVTVAMSAKIGSRMPRTDMDVLLSVEVIIPKLISDQRQIAAKLKTQLAEVETARKALELQFQDVKNLVSRLKNQMFLKLEDTGRIPLGDLLINIESGKSFQTLETLANDDEIGVIKLSAISWGYFNPKEAKAISSDYLPNDRQRINKGDLIISRANTIELVGAVVKADKDYPNRLLSDKTLRLVFDQTQVESDYLLYALRWPEVRKHIEANATGTSDSMRNISQKTINTIPIASADKKLQQEIIEIERNIEFQVNKIETAHKQAMNDLAVLPGKLLAQAFSVRIIE